MNTAIENLRRNLEKRSYTARCFETAAEAAKYLNEQIDGTVVAFGGSRTLDGMGLYESLGAHNTVFWHNKGDSLADEATAKVYISSVNGVAESGELVNIDRTGNRVATIVSGPEKLYLVIGKNKITPDLESAIWRARNIAAPKNAQRLKKNTPCAVKGERCYDCSSPDRLCNVMMVLWGPAKLIPGGTEVLIVNEDLGF